MKILSAGGTCRERPSKTHAEDPGEGLGQKVAEVIEEVHCHVVSCLISFPVMGRLTEMGEEGKVGGGWAEEGACDMY